MRLLAEADYKLFVAERLFRHPVKPRIDTSLSAMSVLSVFLIPGSLNRVIEMKLITRRACVLSLESFILETYELANLTVGVIGIFCGRLFRSFSQL